MTSISGSRHSFVWANPLSHLSQRGRRSALPAQEGGAHRPSRKCWRFGAFLASAPGGAGPSPGSSPGMAAAEGPLADGESLPELREKLRRQERLLGDRKFISRLPDKGKKISDFAERLRAAIAGEEERERTAGLLKAVRSEFRKQHEATGATKADINAIHDHSRRKDVEDIGREAQPRAWTPEGSPGSTSGLSEGTVGVSGLPQGKEKALERPETCRTLSDAFERLSVAGGKRPEAGSNASPFRNFPNVPPKTPHYIEVLEERAKNPVATRRSRFKTNALPAESSGSSHGSPGVSSPGGGLSSSLSAEERRRRDRQHLDDVTAARLPPLHHQPSQLIPIEDSIAIQILQKEQYEETQAKLAAQRLGVKMGRYEPEGEAAAVYREARDEEEEEEEEEGYSSTED